MVVSCGSNPITVTADPEVAEQAMKSVDYVIYQGCYHMDEMAMLSDLLLPEHASLETHTCHLFPGNEGSATNIDPRIRGVEPWRGGAQGYEAAVQHP